ncbi:MAG: sulfatase-like hydrolase/transferase [Cyclobacteriaceae bacterium]|nr:sulfatase-like hydrolase/transferase [Cyclobacteriaceae bacterium]
MRLKIFFKLIFIVLWVFIASSCVKEKLKRKPNVLFIFTDDQSYSTIHALGNTKIKTPNMDKLVQGGVSFRNAYIMGGSSPAVCSPSRASLFSGLTLWNLENQGIYGFEISEKHKTLPQVFLENGYVTFATGKNEPGRKGHFARSFSDGDKILFRGMTESQYRLPLCPFSAEGNYSSEKEVIHEGTHSAEVYADACIRFLERQTENEQPFFAYVAFQTPHDPRQAPDKFRELYNDDEMELPASFLPQHPFDNGMLNIRDENLAGFPRTPEEVKKHIADYYAMISHDDYQIGRIMDALQKSGKFDNTIIVFASDNGLAVGKHGLMGKQNVYEHSVRVPLIVSGPGIPRGEARDQLCYIYDIYPTLCERAGLPTPETVQFKTLNKVIDGKEGVHREHLYFAFMSWQRAIRNDQFKLIEYCVHGKRFTQLFDLKTDPEELNNLAGNREYTLPLDELRKLLELEKENLNDGNTAFEFTRNQGEKFWNTFSSVDRSEFPKLNVDDFNDN